MHALSRRDTRRPFLVASFLIALMLGGVVSALAPPPANAQGSATLSLTLTPMNSPQPVGAAMNFRISYTCASLSVDCEGAEITMPMPAGFRFEPSSSQKPSGVGSSHTTSVTGSTTTGVTFTFIDPLPGGYTGDLFATFYAEEPFVPDGTTTTFTANFTALNATTVTSTADFTLNADLELGMVKRLLTNGLDPALNTPVTYQLRACDYTNGGSNGSWAVENAVIVDTLPPNSDFISATHGGVYDPATHTVTWPARTVAQSWYECSNTVTTTSDQDAVYLTVSFPDDANDPDGPGFVVTDMVTNNATVDGHGFGDPTATISASGSLTHGFTDPNLGGTFAKTDSPSETDTVALGESFTWYLRADPAGNTPFTGLIEDNLPTGFITNSVYFYKGDLYPTVTAATFTHSGQPDTAEPVRLHALQLDDVRAVVPIGPRAGRRRPDHLADIRVRRRAPPHLVDGVCQWLHREHVRSRHDDQLRRPHHDLEWRHRRPDPGL